MFIVKRGLVVVLLVGAVAALVVILFVCSPGAGQAHSMPNSSTPADYIFLPLALREPTPTPTLTPTPTPPCWCQERRAETRTEYTVGRTIYRSNALDDKVHGQFGCGPSRPWPAQSGFVRFADISIVAPGRLYLYLRYSKDSSAWAPICVYLDDEPSSRACFTPVNQGGWNRFAWLESIDLGPVSAGTHDLKLDTAGQQYGVADLDHLVLSNYLLARPRCP